MAKIRISAAGFKAGPIKTFTDFADHCTQLVNQAKSDSPDFLVFPELFTAELMSFFEESDLPAKFDRLTTYTDDYQSLFKELAKENGFLIIEVRKESSPEYKYTSASLTTKHKAMWVYGRIEVRAVTPPARRAAPAKPARSGPMLSLDDYLRQRQGGER